MSANDTMKYIVGTVMSYGFQANPDRHVNQTILPNASDGCRFNITQTMSLKEKGIDGRKVNWDVDVRQVSDIKISSFADGKILIINRKNGVPAFLYSFRDDSVALKLARAISHLSQLCTATKDLFGS